MANRAADWLAQALRDLEQAEDSRTAGRHEWACFAAHRAAEKAERGRVLDTFYIPSRYPNSHPEGAPFEHYGPL
jgi:HEPN domain-containing protein